MASRSRENLSGWEYLPTEIKVAIIGQLEDLGSLGAIFHASPSLYRSCGHSICEYVEVILNHGYTCGHVRVLFRICTMIRLGALPVNNTSDFCRRVTGEAMCFLRRIKESPWGIAPRQLPRNVELSAVIQLLLVANQVERLAADCLQFYLRRFISLRPRHPFPCPNVVYPQPDWPGEPVRIQDLDQFEWDEHQRAVRAIWRVQLIYELKRAVFGTKILAWEDPRPLRDTLALALDGDTQRSFYTSQTACQSTTHDDSDSSMAYSRLRHPWPSRQCSPEDEEMRAVAEYIEDRYGEKEAVTYRSSLMCLFKLQLCSSSPILVRQPTKGDWRKLINEAYGVIAWNAVHAHIKSPNVQGLFKHNERVGFAFWSALRLQKYGLFLQHLQKEWAAIRWHYAWNSITRTAVSPEAANNSS